MDQGDAANALLPIDFDTIDWSLWEDDWASGPGNATWDRFDESGQQGHCLFARHPTNVSQPSPSSQLSQLPFLQLSHPNSNPTNLQQLGIGTFEPWMFVTGDPASCIPDRFSPHLTVERRHPEARDAAETIWSAGNNWGTLREDGDFPLPLERPFMNPVSGEMPLPQDGQHGLQSLSKASSTGEPTRNMSNTMQRARPKTSKPRLPCAYPGCKSTFPRKYELDRHESNVHQRKVNVLCPVYGCNRTAKPFGRLDKFKEHFRKHRSSDNFLCLIEGCHAGPFTLHLLAEHLGTAHIHDHPQSANLYDVMKILSPNVLVGKVLFEIAQKQQEGKDACPLAAGGCDFRLSFVEWDMDWHILIAHKTINDRVRFFDTLVAYGIRSPLSGVRYDCPICGTKSIYFGPNWLGGHLRDYHSHTERRNHAKELVEMFGPYPSDNPALLAHQRLVLGEFWQEYEVSGNLAPSIN